MIRIFVLTATLAASTALTAWSAPPGQPATGVSGEASREALEAAFATAPVQLDSEVLFKVRGTTSFPAEQRALAIHDRIVAPAQDPAVSPETVRTVESETSTDIMAGDYFIMSVFDADARLEGLGRQELAATHARRIRQAIERYRSDRSPESLMRDTSAAAIATVVFIAAFWLGFRLFRRAEQTIEARYKARIHGLTIRSFEVIHAEQLWGALRRAIHTLRLITGLALLFVYFHFTLGLFPWTRAAGHRLAHWVFEPFVILGHGAIGYLPNLIFLAILFIITRYVLKVARLFFTGLERGTVTISGFDADWAQPTYRIVRLAVVVFALVVAYPYIPGAESPAFKGLSIFLGVIVSLGSSSVIANILAGYSLTYRRAFKVGDRVKIEGVVGDIEKVRLQVTHLTTIKNEEVVVPNSKILNTEILNYSSLARTRGLILHTTVGIGYETPWRQVVAMLKIAADRTAGLLKNPEPFVRQLSLGDFCVTYELNAYCDNAQSMAQVYSDMHRNILDLFNEYGVQIMTPAYEGDPAQPKVVRKEDWFAAPAAPPDEEEAHRPAKPP
ncbi:MAG TPA: mechanosensitive ion channel domain-containing protein [Nitrospiria bacterium]|jgi:small-conductance mechanosensitive channel|nr:mechanosensitive ion channel domain-containing protein [Nitrospiria bacterium]